MNDLKLHDVSVKLHSLEQLNLCESEARQMVTDTVDIYTDYMVNDDMKEEAKQLKFKLMALSVYYPQYFGYNPELMSDITEALYSKVDEGDEEVAND